MRHAGFWKRVAAALLDGVILGVAAVTIGSILGIPMAVGRTHGSPELNSLCSFLAWFYCATMESSSLQGTLGKLALGIKVTDLDGNMIGFGRATGRHFAKLVSALLLGIGFIMVAFTKEKQGLHDMMAGTLVVKKGTSLGPL